MSKICREFDIEERLIDFASACYQNSRVVAENKKL
jgi:hypothetical protein